MTDRSDFGTEFTLIFAILVLVINKMHYDGVEAMYCDFKGCKSGNFQMKNCDIS